MKTDRKHKPFKPGNGFTLIETMIAVAIVGIVAAFGMPALSEFFERQKLNVGAESISIAMSTARSTALNDLVDVRVCWNNGTESRTVDTIVIEGGSMAVFKVSPAELIRNFAYNDGMFVADSDTDNCVSFDTQGRIDLTSITGTSMMFAICRKAEETEDSRNVLLTQTGRALSRPNVEGETTVLMECK